MGCQNSQLVADIPQNIHSLQQANQSIQNVTEALKIQMNETKTIKISVRQDNKENNINGQTLTKCEKKDEIVQQASARQAYCLKSKSKSDLKKTSKFDEPLIQGERSKKQINNNHVAQIQISKPCSLKVIDQKTPRHIQNIGPSTVSIGQIDQKPEIKAQTKKTYVFPDFQVLPLIKPEFTQQKAEQNIIKVKQNTSQEKRPSRSSLFNFQIFAQSGQLISKTQQLIELQINNQQKQEVDKYLKSLLDYETKELVSRIITHLQQRQQKWKVVGKNVQQSS